MVPSARRTKKRKNTQSRERTGSQFTICGSGLESTGRMRHAAALLLAGLLWASAAVPIAVHSTDMNLYELYGGI